MRYVPRFRNVLKLPGDSSRSQGSGLPAPFWGPVLLATNGGASANGAVALAARLVQIRHVKLDVLNVLEPDAVEVLAAALVAEGRENAHALHRLADQNVALHEQLDAVADIAEPPEIISLVGAPAPTIAHEAARLGAALILVGLRTHSILDRLFRDDTTLRVMRRATVPVLGVTPLVRDLPKRAVAGVDFGVSSLHAARAAMELLEDGGTLYLAHVEPDEHDGDGRASGEALLASAHPSTFERFRRLLEAPDSVRIEQVVLQGDRFEELDDFANRVGADLVALGSIDRDDTSHHGGRLREAFVRSAATSVLIGPPAPHLSILDE